MASYRKTLDHVELRVRERIRMESGPIRGSEGVVELVRPLYEGLDQERMTAIGMDARNVPMFAAHISTGSRTASLCHPVDVFRPAVIAGASSLILVHNHPSGDPTHSRDDVEVTCRLHDAGRILGVELVDHIILGHECYTSFVDSGLRPFDKQRGALDRETLDRILGT